MIDTIGIYKIVSLEREKNNQHMLWVTFISKKPVTSKRLAEEERWINSYDQQSFGWQRSPVCLECLCQQN
jgi:hypothetical protein